jgi:hypothetical protein
MEFQLSPEEVPHELMNKKLLFKMLQQWPCIGQLTYTYVFQNQVSSLFAAISTLGPFVSRFYNVLNRE